MKKNHSLFGIFLLFFQDNLTQYNSMQISMIIGHNHHISLNDTEEHKYFFYEHFHIPSNTIIIDFRFIEP